MSNHSLSNHTVKAKPLYHTWCGLAPIHKERCPVLTFYVTSWTSARVWYFNGLLVYLLFICLTFCYVDNSMYLLLLFVFPMCILEVKSLWENNKSDPPPQISIKCYGQKTSVAIHLCKVVFTVLNTRMQRFVIHYFQITCLKLFKNEHSSYKCLCSLGR